MVYDALNRETQRFLANGVNMNRGFDADGRLVSLTYQTAAGSLRLMHTMTYDAANNLLTQLEADGALTTFSYDAAYQLAAEQRSGSNAYSRGYAYDAVGNRVVLDADGVLTTTTYDAANQPVVAATGAALTTYTYDGAGNRALQDAAGALTTYTFNQDNKMVGLARPGQPAVTLLYAANGDLRRQADGSGITAFVRDGEALLQEREAVTGDLLRQYTGSPGEWGGLISLAVPGDLVEAVQFNLATFNSAAFNASIREAASSYFLLDQIGTARGLLDAAATQTDDYGYTAFGQELWESGTGDTPLRYVADGQYQRLAEDLINVGARIYDPVTGTWLSNDPIGFEGGDENLFRYVANGPTEYDDPSGLVAPVVVIGIGIGIRLAPRVIPRLFPRLFPRAVPRVVPRITPAIPRGGVPRVVPQGSGRIQPNNPKFPPCPKGSPGRSRGTSGRRPSRPVRRRKRRPCDQRLFERLTAELHVYCNTNASCHRPPGGMKIINQDPSLCAEYKAKWKTNHQRARMCFNKRVYRDLIRCPNMDGYNPRTKKFDEDIKRRHKIARDAAEQSRKNCELLIPRLRC